MPFFSIVIPTKDRPECVEIILNSIKKQTYQDYEVVISDNGSIKPCWNVVEDMHDERFRYYRTERSLGMSDSFESAINHAEGQWVMMFGDKTILYPNALQKIYSVIQKSDSEIVNFGQDFFAPFNAGKNLLFGKVKKMRRTGKFWNVDPEKALEAILSFRYLLAGYEKEWYIGSIYCGGGYSREFIEKIRTIHPSGRIFDGMVPDRFGAAEALCIAKKIVWIDENIQIYNACGKNTWSGTVKKGFDGLREVVEKSRADKSYLDKLLIPYVVASVNNIVASDYANAVEQAASFGCGNFEVEKIDTVYLSAVVSCELREENNIDREVLDGQIKLVDDYIGKFHTAEMEKFKQYQKELKEREVHKNFKIRIMNSISQCINSNYKILQHIGTCLLNVLSSDSCIIRDLSDLK